MPKLGIAGIKAKVDTGARTSALHAFTIRPFTRKGVKKVRFGIHPFQRNRDIEIFCVADVADERVVTDSGGHRERRFVIKTEAALGKERWPVEITLTNRDTMAFRMLLGRTALKGKFLVDSNTSFRFGRWDGRKIQIKSKKRKGASS